jgi:hypothetical protein
MPDIVLPHTPVDGAVSSADGISQNLYDPAAAPNSYEVINGRLNNPNRRATWDVDSTQIQKNGCSGGGSVGATLGLNYFGDLFEAYVPAENPSALFEAIPGSSIEFFLPYDSTLVILTWTIYTQNADGVNGAGGIYDVSGRIMLYVDDVRIPAKIMPAGTAGLQTHSRTWAGHIMLDGPPGGSMWKGWHSASLRVVAYDDEPFVRVGCRSMQYVYFS